MWLQKSVRTDEKHTTLHLEAPLAVAGSDGFGKDLELDSIMVGNRYWMPPPRQFQPMFQSALQAIQLLGYNPEAKIQLYMNIIGPARLLMRALVYLSA